MLRTRPEWEDFLEQRKGKIRVFGFALGIGCLVMVLRLWHLQVIEHSSLAGRAESNRIRQVTLDGRRGLIVDRAGTLLVSTRPAFQLSIIPEDSVNPLNSLEFLARRIKFDLKAAMAKFKAARPFDQVVLTKDLDRQSVAFVEENRPELPGVEVNVKFARHYIYGGFASHVFGYLGSIAPEELAAAEHIYSMGDFVGQTGLEKEFESYLRSVKGLKRVEVDAAGRELASLGTEPPQSGRTLQLTLDYDAQKAAEEALEGRRGAAVAMDPATGEILAMVSKPSYDPNLFTLGVNPKNWSALSADPAHPLQNRVMQGQYPPGSTFKIVMALAALEEKVTSPTAEINCPGYFHFANKSFRCWKKSGHGAVNVTKAIVESCDVYFYTMGSRLGVDKISKYARRMGLGVKTGLQLGGEKAGLIPSEEWKRKTLNVPWYPGETVSCAIGQGYVLATPLQLARMAAMAANGGKFLTPSLAMPAEKQMDPKQQAGQFEISPESMRIVREALRQVVASPNGTARRLNAGPYEYAGKTGTAQVVRMKEDGAADEGPTPDHLKDHALFVAFAPFDSPKIAVAVIAENSGHGGDVAAPIAKSIMDAYLAKLPDIKPKSASRPLPPAAPAKESAPSQTPNQETGIKPVLPAELDPPATELTIDAGGGD